MIYTYIAERMHHIVTCSIAPPSFRRKYCTHLAGNLHIYGQTHFFYNVHIAHPFILIDYLLWVHRYRDLEFLKLALLLFLLQCVLNPNYMNNTLNDAQYTQFVINLVN